MKKLLLLALLAGCRPTPQEQAVIDFMRGPDGQRQHRMHGYLPSSYQPLSFGTLRQCHQYEMTGTDHALPGDTCLIGNSLMHHFWITTRQGEVVEDSCELVLFYEGGVNFLGH